MINIKLTKGYSISSDSKQWILKKEKGDTQFFSKMESLLKFYADTKARESKAASFAELRDVYQSVLDEIKSFTEYFEFKLVK